MDYLVEALLERTQKDTGNNINRTRVRSAPSYYFNDEKEDHHLISHKRGYPEKRISILGPSFHVSSIAKPLDATSKSKKHVYFYEACRFSHFAYIYDLTMKCKERIEKVQSKTLKEVFIKVEVVGFYTEDNLKLISKRKGKCEITKDHSIWASLHLCFQNDLPTETALEILRTAPAEHRILVKSDSFYNGCDKNSIIIVGQHKQQIKEAITSCLEDPLHNMLQGWLKNLKSESSNKHASEAEIEAICKQMVFEDNKEQSFFPGIPRNVKDYLFGRSDVNSFGIWRNSSFKVLVEKETDKIELKSELMTKSQSFFNKYRIEIENGKLIERKTIKQGNAIHSINDDKAWDKGTLGGFVEQTRDKSKKYALTCDHLFSGNNQIAYADDSEDDIPSQIGTCVFKTRAQSCDFAAIEIEECVSEKCDITFRRDDKKKTNAHVYSNDLKNCHFVHKIGSTTEVTNGYILSPDFCYKTADINRESIFLVKGTDGKFSDEGDSGSLVFSRPRSLDQSYINVVGMVFANNQTVNAEDDENNEPTDNSDSSKKCGAKGIQTADELSGCYRIHTALELFKDSQGQDFEVNFKDDLPSTSCSSEYDD